MGAAKRDPMTFVLRGSHREEGVFMMIAISQHLPMSLARESTVGYQAE